MTGYHVDMKTDVDYHVTMEHYGKFFLHLVEEQMPCEAIDMDKPKDTHQKL